MAFCPACRAPVNGRFCPACGSTNVTAIAAPAANAGLTENTAGALCYLGGLITGILFLAISPYNRNPRIRFHAFQSILCSLVWALGWFAIVAVGMILPLSIAVMVSLFSTLLWGGGLLLWMLLLWKAYQGETLAMPVIGGMARQQAGK
jgi:uncharacterized membrane protein